MLHILTIIHCVLSWTKTIYNTYSVGIELVFSINTPYSNYSLLYSLPTLITPYSTLSLLYSLLPSCCFLLFVVSILTHTLSLNQS
jgi:hypothetical protein